MATAVAVLASLGFIVWLVYRGVTRKTVRAHNIAYAMSVITGVFTFVFFLNMDIPQLIKVVVSIFLGMVLIVLAAYLQRRRQASKP